MIGLFVLSVLVLAGAIGFALLLSLALVIKVALWVLLLPFRLLFYVLFLPLLLVKWTLRFFLALLILPLALVGIVLGIGGIALAGVLLFLPLVPLLIVGALIWLIVKAATRPALTVVGS
jgi:hypothetical protein